MPRTHKIESISLHALGIVNIISRAPLTASPEASTPRLAPWMLQCHKQMVPESYRGKKVCIVSGKTGSKEPWLLELTELPLILWWDAGVQPRRVLLANRKMVPRS